VEPTVFRMNAIPPMPPDAYAARDPAWKETYRSAPEASTTEHRDDT
jgi:hypothetical protein